MKKDKNDKRIRRARVRAFLIAILFAPGLVFLCSCGGGDGAGAGDTASPGGSGTRDATPRVLLPEAPGELAVGSEKAVLDYSNASEGYICAKSLLAEIPVKALVDVGGVQYQYDLNANEFTVIPLSAGEGSYQVGLWENVYADQFAHILSQEITVSFSEESLPFLYPNSYVAFAEGDAAVAFSQELATGAGSDVEAVERIYDYVTENISYDVQKATTVQSGYLPDSNVTLRDGTGICFDFAALTAVMLRAQRIPARLVVGYAGSAYHAWVDVYTKEEGWIHKEFYFNGVEWVRMDPTFAAAGGNDNEQIQALVGNGSNYEPRFLY
jgi:hypothetical protein